MILADTSVWVDHLRNRDEALAGHLDQGRILAHPFVIGEIALGGLRRRDLVLSSLANLPKAPVAAEDEVLHFIDQNSLWGLGIGYVDAHLLASTQLMSGAVLWTRDRKLQKAALKLGLAMNKGSGERI